MVFPVVTAALLAACGDPNNGPGAPTAVAGEDQTVYSGETVALDGTGSRDADGLIIGYAWEQTAGPDVSLDDSGLGTASFVAPPSGETGLSLTFQLTATDNQGKKGTDTVVVTVAPEGSSPGFGVLQEEAFAPENFTLSGGKAFFTGLDSDDGYGDRDRLWVSDGTRSGTFLLKEMNTGGQGYAVILTAFQEGVVFTVNDGTYHDALWFSDGTQAGTRLIKDVTTTASENIRLVGVGGDRFYFSANDGVHGRELWASDGSPEGTHLIADLNPDGDSTVERAQVATYWNGHFYFYAWHYETGTVNAYPQLYRTNGTAGHLEQLTTNDLSGSVLLDYDLIVFQDRLFFTWHTRTNGVELWVTDGTPGGTQLFKEIVPGDYSGWPGRFHLLGGKLVFFAYEEGTGAHQSLWSSDGTAAGTQLVAQVDLFVSTEDMVLFNGKYYFPGRTYDTNAVSLWATDGTSGGTAQVSPVAPDGSDLPQKMVVAGGHLVFKGTDGVHGYEPWVSDGTTQGTLMLKDIHPTTGSSTSGGMTFTVRGEKAYFVAAPADEDFQLFETDGTAEGTQILVPEDATVTTNPLGQTYFYDIVPMQPPTALGSTLLFKAKFHGSQLLYRN